MLFNSADFLIFFPIVVVIYFLIPEKFRYIWLLAASYYFYMQWNPAYGLLLLSSTLITYFGARILERLDKEKPRKVCLCIAVILNLSLLVYFKYTGMLVGFASKIFTAISHRSLNWEVNILLPVGISFFTLQALGYLIDVYRGDIYPEHNILRYALFISFFPQLVAGPIERASHLLPQFRQERHFCYADAADGCRPMLWGFFKKMVIADNCATIVNVVWADYDSQSSMMLMVSAVFFAFQIYCDFSGYSDIAIGCARLFGIRLMRNFNYPYFSHGIADFWRRWHISLMTWLRDYVYIPLGGNRKGSSITLRNIFTVWGISGLWHGANWTFVCWGLYHAMLLSAYRLIRIQSVGRILSVCITFLFVVIGWIIFRAPTLHDAFCYLSRMLSPSELNASQLLPRLMSMQSAVATAAIGITVMTLCEWRGRHYRHALQFWANSFLRRHASLRYAFYIVMAMSTMAFAGSQSEFIYFQF